MKIGNDYQRAYPAYGQTPKAVIAAVAYSLAQRLCDGDDAAAVRLLCDEWAALNENGIVDQKCTATYDPV